MRAEKEPRTASQRETENETLHASRPANINDLVIASAKLESSVQNETGICSCVCINDCNCDGNWW